VGSATAWCRGGGRRKQVVSLRPYPEFPVGFGGVVALHARKLGPGWRCVAGNPGLRSGRDDDKVRMSLPLRLDGCSER
jgi:hypothetical protein